MASRFITGREDGQAYAEDELLPLSGLQHMVFCDRQAALIHVDGIWADNALTVEGEHLHRIVDEGDAGSRDGIRIARGVRLVSRRLGLVGRADVIELTPTLDGEGGVKIDAYPGRWLMAPVEYKRGKPKTHRADEVQLCAQGVCLEEEFETSIPTGKLFYGRTRRRVEVPFTRELRTLTERVARSFHELVRSRQVPMRTRERKCDRCSLLSVCLPPRPSGSRSGRAFLDAWIARVDSDQAGL